MEPSAPFGERVAFYRRRRGLSQAKLAGLIGRSESWVSQVSVAFAWSIDYRSLSRSRLLSKCRSWTLRPIRSLARTRLTA